MTTLYLLRLVFTWLWIFTTVMNTTFVIKYRTLSDFIMILYSFITATTACLILMD